MLFIVVIRVGSYHMQVSFISHTQKSMLGLPRNCTCQVVKTGVLVIQESGELEIPYKVNGLLHISTMT